MGKSKKKYTNFFESSKEVTPVETFNKAASSGEVVTSVLKLAEARKKMSLIQARIQKEASEYRRINLKIIH